MLAERERQLPRMAPWVVLAAGLHGLVVGAAFFLGRTAAARPAHLPAVSVKLVRPDRPPGTAPTRRQPKPTMAAPTPVPTRAATAVPQPRPTAAAVDRASEDAMPVPDAEPTSAPTPETEPVASGRGSGGLSLGGGGGGQTPGLPADFQFTYYIERMLALIESRWFKPAVPEGTAARVRFRIHRDGRLDGIALEASSGSPSFDRAALRAMYAANPLPPLPPAYRTPTLTVHLTFSE
jgi:TonB family protein